MSATEQNKPTHKKEKPKTFVTLGDYFKTTPKFEKLYKNLTKRKYDNKKH